MAIGNVNINNYANRFNSYAKNADTKISRETVYSTPENKTVKNDRVELSFP